MGSEVPSALGVSLLYSLPAEESAQVVDLPDSQSSSILALAWLPCVGEMESL